jgi:hypothetical protein
MLESLEKMLAKGVDNSLLRFGLGKGYLDLGRTPRLPSISSAASRLIRSIRRRGSCWARLTWRGRSRRRAAGVGAGLEAARAHGDKQARRK